MRLTRQGRRSTGFKKTDPLHPAAQSGALTDYFSAGLFGSGKYDLTAYGANGFQRRFAGNLNTLCNELEASVAIDPNADSVTLLLRNSSGGSVQLISR